MRKKQILILLVISIILLGSCATCFLLGVNSRSDHNRNSQLLFITASSADEPTASAIPAEELGGNYPNRITYSFITDVKIKVNGKTLKLEHAIRDDVISVEEIFAFARIDSRNGYCKERNETENGLTVFTFIYDQVQLQMTYDVYETPDGKEHLINMFSVSKPGTTGSHVIYTDGSDRPIDYEDWGLKFSVESISSEGITILCNQSGGQQNGTLYIESYMISSAANGEPVLPLAGIYSEDDFTICEIAANSNTKYSIDWLDVHGKLPAGDYILRLQIHDSFDAATAHPLMQNFRDYQIYYIAFTIK